MNTTMCNLYSTCPWYLCQRHYRVVCFLQRSSQVVIGIMNHLDGEGEGPYSQSRLSEFGSFFLEYWPNHDDSGNSSWCEWLCLCSSLHRSQYSSPRQAIAEHERTQSLSPAYKDATEKIATTRSLMPSGCAEDWAGFRRSATTSRDTAEARFLLL